MSVDEDRAVCQVFDVSVHGERIAYAADLGWAYVAAIGKASVIHGNYMIAESSHCLVQVDTMSISACSRVAMQIQHNRVLRLSQNLLEQARLVAGIIHVEIAPHHRFNDLVAVLSWIVKEICIIMNVICYIFECLGAKLQLFLKSLRYVIRYNVPCGDGDFRLLVVVVI